MSSEFKPATCLYARHWRRCIDGGDGLAWKDAWDFWDVWKQRRTQQCVIAQLTHWRLVACNGCSLPPQRCNGTPDVLLLNDDPRPYNRGPSDRHVHPWSAEEDAVAGDCSSSLRARLAPFEPDADGIAAVIILACSATLTFSSFSVRSHIGYSSTSPFPVIASSSRVSTRRPGHSCWRNSTR